MIRNINQKQVRINSDTTQTRSTSPTGDTILNVISIPANKIKPPDTLLIRSAILKSGTTDTMTMRLYWSTNPGSVATATQLGVYVIPASTQYIQFYRKIFFSDNNTGIMVSTAYNGLSDLGDIATTISTISISNWLSTQGYFITAIDAVGTPSDEISGLYLSAEI